MAAAGGMRSDLRTVNRATPGVRLQVSQGIHPAEFDAFVVGDTHRELLLVGPGVVAVIGAEAAAGAGEILVTRSGATDVDSRHLGEARDPGLLIRRFPALDPVEATDPALADGGSFLPVMVRECLGAAGGEGEDAETTAVFDIRCVER